MKFPNLVYKSPGTQQAPGGTYNWKAVNDEDELRAAAQEGWFPNPEIAVKRPVFFDWEEFHPGLFGEPKAAPKGIAIGDKKFSHADIVTKAQEASGLTSAEWNALSEEERDALMQGMITALENSIAPSRAELEEKATALGIKFGSNIKDATLAAKIEEALKKG